MLNLRSQSEGPTAARVPTLAKVWQRDLPGAVSGTPILSDNGGVYVGTSSGTLYALTNRTGGVFWARFLGGPIMGSPVIFTPAGGEYTVYAVTSFDRSVNGPTLTALDPLTGAIRWKTTLVQGRDYESWGSPNVSIRNNMIYATICSCTAEQTNRSVKRVGGVVAVDATSGEVKWAKPTVKEGFGGGVRGGAAVYDELNRVFVATDHATTSISKTASVGEAGTDAIVAFDATSGERLGTFQARNDDVADNTNNDPRKRIGFTAAPNMLSDAGRLLVGAGAKDGNYYAVDPVTMKRVWSTTTGLGSPVGGIRWASAWNSRRGVIGSTASPSSIFSLRSGGVLGWAFPSAAQESGPMTFSRDVAWATNTAGFLDAYDAVTGRLLGRAPLPAPSIGGVSTDGGMVFAAVGTTTSPDRGAVVAFK